jgi:tetratricopeptide (TPR) repeat protein
MPYNLNGVSLATMDDLNSIEHNLSLLDRSVKRLDDSIRQRTEELKSFQAETEKKFDDQLRLIRLLDKRATDLEKALRDAVDELNRTLDQISNEVETSTGYLEETNQHLVKNDTAMVELNGQVKFATEQEGIRRTQVAEKIEAVLTQQKNTADALASAFKDLQSGFADLIKAEEENTHLLEHSIRLVREALIDVQSQTQEELMQAIDALQIYRQTKQERGKEEDTLFAHLLEVQETMRKHLATLESTTATLTDNTSRAESLQMDRLMDRMKAQARSMNQDAMALMMRGEASLAASLLDNAVEIDPETPVLAQNQILAHIRADHLDQAEKLIKPRLDSDPLNPHLLHLAGLIHLIRGELQAALDKLLLAIQLDDQDGEIFFTLGKAYYKAGQIQPALEAWNHAALLMPELAEADPLVRILLEEQHQQGKLT